MYSGLRDKEINLMLSTSRGFWKVSVSVLHQISVRACLLFESFL